MRLACDSADLAAALATVARAISTRTTLPVLGMVLLETTDRGLRLTTTNLELGIRSWIDAEVVEDGAVAVPGRLLADFTGAMPRETVELELDGEHVLGLRSRSFQTRVHGIQPDEFPPAVAVEGGERLAIPARELLDAIGDTLVTASTDEARPVLTGVHLELDGDRLVLTASDGYRLAVRPLGVAADSEALARPGITVPARSLAEVGRLFRHVDGEMELLVSPPRNQVLFRAPGLEVTSRVIDGAPLDHRRLVPAASPTRVTVSAGELGRRVRALTPFAQGSANVVRLGVAPGSLLLSAAATDVGSARTDMEAAVAGPETAVAFNARYLLDCPALAGEDRVELHLAGPMAPVVVRRTTGDGYVYLFMPVRHPV